MKNSRIDRTPASKSNTTEQDPGRHPLIRAAMMAFFLFVSGSMAHGQDCNGNGIADDIDIIADINNLQVDLEIETQFDLILYGRAVGDVTGDGWPDIVVAETGGNVQVLENQGNGTFIALPPQTGLVGTGSFEPELILVDFNGDGWLDIVACGTSTVDDELIRCRPNLGLGGGQFGLGWDRDSQPGTPGVDGPGIIAMTSDFINGSLALVVAEYGADLIVLHDIGNALSTNTEIVDNAVDLAGGIVTADLNNDGFPEIAVTSYNGATVEIYQTNPLALLSSIPTSASPTPPRPWKIEAGEINLDGFQDLVVSFPTDGGNVVVYLGDGSGSFSPASSYTVNPLVITVPTSPACHQITLSDLDNDGDLDLVVSNPTIVCRNDSTGFTPVFTPVLELSITSPSPGNSGNGLPRTLMDLDGDCIPDVVATADPLPSGNQRVAVFLSDPFSTDCNDNGIPDECDFSFIATPGPAVLDSDPVASIASVLISIDEATSLSPEISGISISLGHDSSVLENPTVELSATLADLNNGTGPGFLAVNPCSEGITIGVVTDIVDPCALVLSVSGGLDVVTIDYDVTASAAAAGVPLETTVDFVDGLCTVQGSVNNTVSDCNGNSYPIAAANRFGAILVFVAEEQFMRPDCNGDGVYDIADAISVLGYLFTGTAVPSCLAACDANADGTVNVADAITNLNGLFVPGSPPIAERCGACGFQPFTPSAGCVSYESCP